MNEVLRDDKILIVTTDRNDGYFSNMKLSNNMAYRTAGDEDMILNIKQLCTENNIKFSDVYIPKQTHSDIIKEVTRKKDDLSNCDALYTKEKDTCLGVLTADCLPILVYFPDKEIVAAAHAGWVGSIKLIAYKLITQIVIKEQVNPSLAEVYLCPSICQECYEVGREVYERAIANEFIDSESCFINLDNCKYLFDNRLFNILQLKASGIKEENISIVDRCTFLDDNYFSHRQDKTKGRQLSLIGMRGHNNG